MSWKWSEMSSSDRLIAVLSAVASAIGLLGIFLGVGMPMGIDQTPMPKLPAGLKPVHMPSFVQPVMPDVDAIERRMPAVPGEEVTKQRIVRVQGAIDDENATLTIARLLFLDDGDRPAPIRLLVDSPGGQAAATLAILDTMKALKAPVHTRCETACWSAAAIIMASGTKGCRSAAPGARFMLTGVWAAGGEENQETVEKLERALAERLAAATGQTVETVLADMRAGREFTAQQAVEYGLIDKVE